MTQTPSISSSASDTSALWRGWHISPAMLKAMESVEQRTTEAEADPLRPTYHFTPPAQWTNDPNGTVYHDGWYHMFYQHNPDEPVWGNMHWGHARSRDLIHWEHLPVGLTPAHDRGEDHCWSGCCVIDGKGTPKILYTSIKFPDRNELDAAEQWVAEGDPDLINWTRPAQNPFVDESEHDQKIYDWRDPFVFRVKDKPYMILGGNTGRRKPGSGVVALYEARDDSMTAWKYRGIVYRCPETDCAQVDCPNFMLVDGRWVLLYSPWHGAIRYIVGDLDVDDCSFTAETVGMMDYGPDLFATNTFHGPNPQTGNSNDLALIAWVRGYRHTKAWRGAMCMPRRFRVDEDGVLRQSPHEAIESLFEAPIQSPNVTRTDSSSAIEAFSGVTSRAYQLTVTLKPDCEACGLGLLVDDEGKPGFEVRLDGDGLHVNGVSVYAVRPDSQKPLDLRILVDHSLIEVFADDGRWCIVRVNEHLDPTATGITAFAEHGSAEIIEPILTPLASPTFAFADGPA